MSAPALFPSDWQRQQDVVEAVAETPPHLADPEYRVFLDACKTAAIPDGRVRVNEVRRLLTNNNGELRINARRLSAFWHRATAKGGPMVDTSDWELSESTKTGRNGGKPQRVRRWVG